MIKRREDPELWLRDDVHKVLDTLRARIARLEEAMRQVLEAFSICPKCGKPLEKRGIDTGVILRCPAGCVSWEL